MRFERRSVSKSKLTLLLNIKFRQVYTLAQISLQYYNFQWSLYYTQYKIHTVLRLMALTCLVLNLHANKLVIIIDQGPGRLVFG